MYSLMISFLTTTSLILESPALVLGALCAIGVCLMPSVPREGKSVKLSRHTLADIGIEPSSITWLR